MTGPIRSRASWVASGLILQAVGAGGVATPNRSATCSASGRPHLVQGAAADGQRSGHVRTPWLGRGGKGAHR